MLPVLIDNFYNDALRLIADAQQTLEQGKRADLRRAAHTLKSNSATFGAMALAALARDLEDRARDGVLDGASGVLAQIANAYEKAKAALEVQRKEL